ncbi:MAG: hypothetical protein QM811_17005 [Pirellulales bacterium]
MTSLTMVSAILWDGVDPDRCTAEQRAALIDWLHWGGVLIVNGPTSLDQLKGSFLDGGEGGTNLLPVAGWSAAELSNAQRRCVKRLLGRTHRSLAGRTAGARSPSSAHDATVERVGLERGALTPKRYRTRPMRSPRATSVAAESW